MANAKFEELAKIFSMLSAGQSVPDTVRQSAFQQAASVFSILAQNSWIAPTGNKSRATFDPATVTLPQLGERVAALVEDLFL